MHSKGSVCTGEANIREARTELDQPRKRYEALYKKTEALHAELRAIKNSLCEADGDLTPAELAAANHGLEVLELALVERCREMDQARLELREASERMEQQPSGENYEAGSQGPAERPRMATSRRMEMITINTYGAPYKSDCLGTWAWVAYDQCGDEIANQAACELFDEMIDGGESYIALTKAIGWAMHHASNKMIRLRTNSPDIVKQMYDWPGCAPALQPYVDDLKQWLKDLSEVDWLEGGVEFIPSCQNTRAEELAHEATYVALS